MKLSRVWEWILRFLYDVGAVRTLTVLLSNTSQLRNIVQIILGGLMAKGLIDKGIASSEFIIGASIAVLVTLLTRFITYVRCKLELDSPVVKTAIELKVAEAAQNKQP